MVQIEAAQKILIGFPSATVLRHDYARHDLQEFSRTEKWTSFELDLPHPTFGSSSSNASEIIGSTRYYHRLQSPQSRLAVRRQRPVHMP